jgi:hypothetical protein
MFYPFRNSQRVFPGSLRKHQQKLVASVAPEKIIRAKPRGNDLDNLPPRSISCSMARRVVTLFEVVDVDQRYSKFITVALRTRQLKGKPLINSSPVQRTRDMVIQGQRLNNATSSLLSISRKNNPIMQMNRRFTTSDGV